MDTSIVITAAFLAAVGLIIWAKVKDDWYLADFLVVTSSGSQLIEKMPNIKDFHTQKKAKRQELTFLLSPMFVFSRIKMFVNKNVESRKPLLEEEVEENLIRYKFYMPLAAMSSPEELCSEGHAVALGKIVSDYIESRYSCEFMYIGAQLVESKSGNSKSIMWEFLKYV